VLVWGRRKRGGLTFGSGRASPGAHARGRAYICVVVYLDASVGRVQGRALGRGAGALAEELAREGRQPQVVGTAG
jgi:hypothetical protein